LDNLNSSIEKLNNRTQQYLNPTYASSGRSIICSDLYAFKPSGTSPCSTTTTTITDDLIKIGAYYWIATNITSGSSDLKSVESDGYITTTANQVYGYRPVIELKAGIKITGGSGTSDSPYNISI